MSEILQPDFDMAQSFLEEFDPECKCWTFQTFDDNADRKDKRLARTLHGMLEEHWDTLVDLNQQGAGVFFTVQQTDCRGRKKENITRVRAVFQEDDGDGKELAFIPNIVVESSPGKFHRYFILEDATFDDFTRIQQIMVDVYGSDPNAKDLSRVLRLPGFYHQKVNSKKGLIGTPHLVRVMK
jgi:hypothetical protein